MGNRDIARLCTVPWAADLINSPNWTLRDTASRLPKASGEDSFIAETLATYTTIRSLLTLLPSKNEQSVLPCQHSITLVELGDGLNGYPQMAHGGFVTTLLDEVAGVLVLINVERQSQQLKEHDSSSATKPKTYATAYLNTTFKKPVPTPQVVLCKARIERQEGKKLYIQATVEDGCGNVYAGAELLYVEITTKL